MGHIRLQQQERKNVQASIDVARSQILDLRVQVAERRKESKEAVRMGLKVRVGELVHEICSLENRQAKLQADLHRLSNRAAVLDREIKGDRDRFNRHKVDMHCCLAVHIQSPLRQPIHTFVPVVDLTPGGKNGRLRKWLSSRNRNLLPCCSTLLAATSSV